MRGDCHECPTCQGAGVVFLSSVYLETLKGVRRMCSRDGYVVANKHAAWFGCSPTALSNRLAVLEKHGYVFSFKFGRQRRFCKSQTTGVPR